MSVNDPREWARYADQDWQVASSLMRRKHPPTVAICFHAQQSAEKYLKSLLLAAEEAREAVAIARTIRTFARRWLKAKGVLQ